jgi:putative flavoprotein involved in K+ transport
MKDRPLTHTPNTTKPTASAAAIVDAPERSDRFDVVVIDAGQAGLAIGYFLARQGRRFLILEAAGAVGAAWRGRWDLLVLFT